MKKRETKQPRIVIIGGGPTGLGAAYHLTKLGYKNWVLYEKNSYFGGHSSTHTDDKGFLWDEGGHIIFSHFTYYDQFIKEALGEKVYKIVRESWVKTPEAWVPYPFQNHIHRLPPAAQLEALTGLVAVQNKKIQSTNFKSWILNTFGEGIANQFMIPYNFSVWATPAELMAKDWIGERVSVIDIKKILGNMIEGKDDVAWGPNSTFMFPKFGGTREIYERAAENIGRAGFSQNLKLGSELAKIDFDKRSLRLRDGGTDSYDYLISAVPIDKLITNSNAPLAIKKSASQLVFNSIIIIGLGIKKKIETTKCWVYFPDKKVPFYRLTFFHNYSPYVVPEGDTDNYSSLMCEISYSQFKKVDKAKIMEQTIDALVANGIIAEEDRGKIVSKQLFDIRYGYPVPTIDRDRLLKKIQPFLLKKGVFSRGRYGAWKYEISNMDHCVMQGVEAVDKILNNKKETVWTP